MIIIGYQGIGKSTIAKNNPSIIDLESKCFWYNGERPEDWYIYYCQIAEHLSKQGYTVFVSSHKEVRGFLIDNCTEPFGAIVPATYLRYDWIEKLHRRYLKTNSEKDKKAWKNAEDRYIENIQEICEDIDNYVVIQKMDYSLNSVIDMLQQSLDI